MAPGHVLYTMALHHDSGLPRDDSVNTFHFDFADVEPVGLGVIGAGISAFYESFFGVLSSKLNGAFTLKAYNMGDAPPRVTIGMWTGGPGAFTPGEDTLPEECAVCISYAAAPESGVSAANRRGRIYIGPCSRSAQASATDCTVHASFRGNLIDAAEDLRALADTADNPWSVYSRVLNDLFPIAGGWVDNAFDTQRRRGPRATSRDLWS